MKEMIAPCRTVDKAQAERCYRAMLDKATITETFGNVTVTGLVQSVVDYPDATPRNWSITFYPKH